MSTATATVRELRTDFRSVKRKMEQHGQLTITDHGEPLFLLTPVPRQRRKSSPMPDYYARLLRRQPKPMSEEATRRLHEDNRGDC